MLKKERNSNYDCGQHIFGILSVNLGRYILIVEGLADPIRIIFDTEYCAESVAMYIEAANIARSALKMPLINLEDYPD